MDCLNNLGPVNLPKSPDAYEQLSADSAKISSVKDKAFMALKMGLALTLGVGLLVGVVALTYTMGPGVGLIAIVAFAVLNMCIGLYASLNDKSVKAARYVKIKEACDQTLEALKPFSKAGAANLNHSQVQQQMEEILELGNKFSKVVLEKKDVFTNSALGLKNLQASYNTYCQLLKEGSIEDPDVLESLESIKDDFFSFLDIYKNLIVGAEKTSFLLKNML